MLLSTPNALNNTNITAAAAILAHRIPIITNCDADLAVAGLEDLVGPGHDVGNGGAEAKANDEETNVAGPGAGGAREGGDEETSDLNEDGGGKDDRAMMMVSIGEGHRDQDSYEVALKRRSVSALVEVKVEVEVWRNEKRVLRSKSERRED
ncbi:MAG: hypothetical protein Q9165_007463 [Trypethelium subeluteriae]